MTTGSRPPKRPVVGSRNPTGRPRKVAGRGAPPPVETQDGAPTPVELVETPEPEPEPIEEPPVEPVERADEPPAPRARRGFLAGTRTTTALLVALVLLVGVVALESWYLWGSDEETPSADRPVVTGQIAHRAAVDVAAQSTADILTYGHQDFDKQVDEAAQKMTPGFAEQYRKTAAASRQRFITEKLDQEVKIIGQSVVQASDEQVQALLFADQYVTRPGKPTSVTPFRLLVTMRHTDSGWLVDDIAAQ